MDTKYDRGWENLPFNALSVVFEKIGPDGILVSAQFVCRRWWILSQDPRTWKRISFNERFYRLPHGCCHNEKLFVAAVDRTDGGLLEFSQEFDATD